MHAAEAAEAAADQGKFWEMHDALFENQEALEDSDLIRYAQTLGLDAERVERELASGAHETERTFGRASGAASTARRPFSSTEFVTTARGIERLSSRPCRGQAGSLVI
jgi:hypothetical protein